MERISFYYPKAKKLNDSPKENRSLHQSPTRNKDLLPPRGYQRPPLFSAGLSFGLLTLPTPLDVEANHISSTLVDGSCLQMLVTLAPSCSQEQRQWSRRHAGWSNGHPGEPVQRLRHPSGAPLRGYLQVSTGSQPVGGTAPCIRWPSSPEQSLLQPTACSTR